jgi:hypothetical protein
VYGIYTPAEIRGVYTAEEMLGDIVEQTAQTLGHYDQTLEHGSSIVEQAEVLVYQMRAEAEQASQAVSAQLSACTRFWMNRCSSCTAAWRPCGTTTRGILARNG